MEKADKRKYAEDKPSMCKDCYFWNRRKNSCTRKQCYYLLPKQPEKDAKRNGQCADVRMENTLPALGIACKKFCRK